MKLNEIGFILRLFSTLLMVLVAFTTQDLHLSYLFTGLSIFMGVSILKQNFSHHLKQDNYEESK